MNRVFGRQRLLQSSILAAMTLAVPVLAQTTTGTAPPAAAPDTTPSTTAPAAGAPGGTAVTEVVVTGSMLRRRLSDTDAPLTVLTAGDLNARGITTVQQAIQSVSANGSGNLPNSFTANGAFAAGASGVSLRGLTTNSTLTLIDGLRAAYYPLADDGTRNFVDLNTIPDVIVDRIEVLKDGASSVYGADAIAGVVNIITKKTYQGLTLKAEGGGAQHGGAGENNFQLLAGKGDLQSDGFNAYVGLEYEHDDALYNRQRGSLYNTANQSGRCATSVLDGSQTCINNGVVNGIQADGSFLGVGADIVAVVRPYNATNTAPAGNYQLLNQTGGCGALTPVTITAAQASAYGIGGVTGSTLCQQDLTHDYGQITPDDKRFSLSGRATKLLGNDAQAYVAVNYYQNDVNYSSNPQTIRNVTPPAATGVTYSTTSIALPVYVCASGVNCSATNGTLNPNNPFASLGEVARIRYRFGDIPTHEEDFSQTYRFATGLTGTFWGDWHYSADLTGMQTDLTVTSKGYIYVANLLKAIATGSYNFVNPSQNTQAERDFIAPTSVQNSTSKLMQAQGNLSKDLFQLPGGSLQLGLGVSARYESIFNPSANDDSQGATNRYFTINPFGTIGSRETQSASFEVDAPIIKQLDLNLSGRYDNYSTGQSNFSPKIGGKFTPISMVTFRSTYSKGFRIPSFAESNSLPTTGYITVNAPKSFNTAHGNDGYGQSYSLGLTTVGTAGLKPEKSENFNVGIVFDPVRQLSFSIDFYNIKKTAVIAPADYTIAAAAYYAGTPIPAGYQVIADVADPNYPDAKPRIAFIKYGFANLNSQQTAGYDLGATARLNLPFDVKLTSVFDGVYVIRFDQTYADGTTQHYAGTIGPYQTTSASGTPKWRANWQNTFAYGPVTFTGTVYYTSGYGEEAEDNGGTAGDCLGSASTGTPATYRDGSTPIVCKVKGFFDTDVHMTYQTTKHIQLYVDVANLFDTPAPYDPTTYGGTNYNPAWANAGIVGRYFKLGVRASF